MMRFCVSVFFTETDIKIMTICEKRQLQIETASSHKFFIYVQFVIFSHIGRLLS